MTEPAMVDIQCPACGGAVRFAPVTSVQEGDAHLHQLLEGSLNRVQCPACQAKFFYETPMIYHDKARRYLVYYLPTSLMDGVDEALEHMDRLYDTIFAELPEELRPVCRLAMSRNQFIEKIVLHQRQLDDRVVEYVKYQLFQNSQGLDHIRHELLFDFGNSSEEDLGFLAFDRDTGRASYALKFKVAAYRDVQQYFLGEDLDSTKLDELFNGRYVNVDDLFE